MPRPCPRPVLAPVETLFPIVAALALAGCDDARVGRACQLPASPGPLQTVISGEALECDSRLCLKQAAGPSGLEIAPFCTAGCSGDDDCGAGGPGAGGVACARGFTCGVAAVVGPFACKRLCLCRDALPPGARSFPVPPSCAP